MNFFCEGKHPSDEEDTRARKSPIKTVTVILPLEAMTNINPSNISGVAAGVTEGVIVVVTSGALVDEDRATDSSTIAQC